MPFPSEELTEAVADSRFRADSRARSCCPISLLRAANRRNRIFADSADFIGTAAMTDGRPTGTSLSSGMISSNCSTSSRANRRSASERACRRIAIAVFMTLSSCARICTRGRECIFRLVQATLRPALRAPPASGRAPRPTGRRARPPGHELPLRFVLAAARHNVSKALGGAWPNSDSASPGADFDPPRVECDVVTVRLNMSVLFHVVHSIIHLWWRASPRSPKAEKSAPPLYRFFEG